MLNFPFKKSFNILIISTLCFWHKNGHSFGTGIHYEP